MKERKVWFMVESKSFEISIGVVKDKLVGTVLERSQGFSSWISFGEKSFMALLEGVEDCCLNVSGSSFKKFWKGVGVTVWSFEAMLQVSFSCSACSIESKRFILVFPEGKGFLGDWNMLAQKLGSLEVASSSSAMLTGNMMALKEEISSADAVGVSQAADGHPQVAVGEAVWIEKEEREAKRNGENFHLCLVGHWVEHVDFVPDFSSLRKWVAEV